MIKEAPKVHYTLDHSCKPYSLVANQTLVPAELEAQIKTITLSLHGQNKMANRHKEETVNSTL